MVIYTNNLAQKLFGFAMSREQLRNTNLCELLEDPNLQLDIDLAIDFNAAVRGDEDAAERFTNTFILSSALLDYSTNDFYTTRMEQYPVFEYHVDRITYIFNNLDSLNDYYASSSAREKNFIDSLKNALKDCLNSPCNLFAASSESIASIIDNVAASNSTTIPPFTELRDLFKTTYGGIKNTLIKQLPDAVADMVGKMAILGQDAFNQSVDIIYEKDKAKKDKLIADALAGKALDYETTGYVYVPDIEAITSIEGFGASVLSQAASDLGGCFKKYQHLARYSPYDPKQNLSVTSREPIQENVDGKSGSRTTGGMWPFDASRSNNDLNCGLPSATPDVTPPGSDQPNNGSDISPITTAYSPQKDGSAMEGDYRSSKPGLDGKSLVRTLDDYNAGTYNYITLAGDPSQYGKTYIIPQITYINKNNQRITFKNVTGYVHDTGGAFKGVGSTKFDIPIGRDYSQLDIDKQPFSQKRTVFNPK